MPWCKECRERGRLYANLRFEVTVPIDQWLIVSIRFVPKVEGTVHLLIRLKGALASIELCYLRRYLRTYFWRDLG